jgi:flagellar hook assembly protein FlgD
LFSIVSIAQINYSVLKKDRVDIKIFNAIGQPVKHLFNDEKNPGEHHVTWNGENDNGIKVKNGIYFVRFTSENMATLFKVIVE